MVNMINEEYENTEVENENDNEYVENGQSDLVDNLQEPSYNSPCTLVALPNGQIVCQENIVYVPVASDAQIISEEQNIDNSEQSTQDQTRTVSGDTEETEEVTDISLLTDIKETFSTFVENDNTYKIAKTDIDNSIFESISNIELYVSTFFVLWFLGWIWSQLNNWRRNTKV